MKSSLFVLLLITVWFKTSAQNKSLDELKDFLTTNHIEINKPTPLSGYKFYRDCKDHAVYKKISGDTIILYSSSHSIAQTLETFEKTIKDKDFNTLIYPIFFQDNATVVVQHMKKEIFINRNDTLYMYDDYDQKKSDASLPIMDAMWKKTITFEEANQKLAIIRKTDYGFKPHFKMIYFKGIFKDSDVYKFSKKQNFKEESVHLDEKWVQNNKQCFKINLRTHTNGQYIFSEDMVFLDDENCQIDDKSRLHSKS